MEFKLKPLKTYINGYLTIFCNYIVNDNFKKIQNGNDARRDYLVYRWICKRDGIAYYYGKGVLKNGKGEESRPFMHRNDMLSRTINPEEWYCEILFYGLSQEQAYAAEAYLISICTMNRSRKGQRVGDGVSLINKRREWSHEKLIEKNLKLDGNNDGETLRREINGY